MSPAAQFIKITNLMLEYETGDFLMLSDLSDLIAPLKDAFLETNEPYRLIEWLLEKISAEMKKAGCPDFQRHVSDAIDLLQSYLAAERVFAPGKDMDHHLRDSGLRLFRNNFV